MRVVLLALLICLSVNVMADEFVYDVLPAKSAVGERQLCNADMRAIDCYIRDHRVPWKYRDKWIATEELREPLAAMLRSQRIHLPLSWTPRSYWDKWQEVTLERLVAVEVGSNQQTTTIINQPAPSQPAPQQTTLSITVNVQGGGVIPVQQETYRQLANPDYLRQSSTGPVGWWTEPKVQPQRPPKPPKPPEPPGPNCPPGGGPIPQPPPGGAGPPYGPPTGTQPGGCPIPPATNQGNGIPVPGQGTYGPPQSPLPLKR